MAAVGPADPVAFLEQVADGDGRLLLPDRQMDRALDLVRRVDLSRHFLEAPDPLQRAIESFLQGGGHGALPLPVNAVFRIASPS